MDAEKRRNHALNQNVSVSLHSGVQHSGFYSKPASNQLVRLGLYSAITLFFYGTLFPFHFDFSAHALGRALRDAGVVPYWDVTRGRVHGIPDMAANILLTIPLGFFGFLIGRSSAARRIPMWGLAGLACGLVAEVIQLAIPSRTSDLTDALNNGLGAWAGAVAAYLVGRPFLTLTSGARPERKRSYLLLLAGVVAACTLAPFDVSLDISHFRAVARSILNDPWQQRAALEDIWLFMGQFAVLGALAGTMIRSGDNLFLGSRKTALAAVMLLPLVLECAQSLVHSHTAGLRDVLMEMLGAWVGLACGTLLPSMIRPICGAALMALALVGAGLSPYHYVAWHARSTFQWIPLVEYYNRTTASSLSDAVIGLLNYALLGGLLKLSFSIRRELVMAFATTLAAGIELAQTVIPTRSPGMTDILIAALGAWVGTLVCVSIESAEIPAAGLPEEVRTGDAIPKLAGPR